MIYAGAHSSDGRHDAARAIAALGRGRILSTDTSGYWIAQLAAGLLAGALARTAVGPSTPTTLHPMGARAFGATAVIELLLMFALVYVVFHVGTSRRQSDHYVSASRSVPPSRRGRSPPAERRVAP